jgi:glycosyltransferase involved in cell wall biosynthesis
VKILVLDSTVVEGISEGPGSPAYFSRFAIGQLTDDGHTVIISNDPQPELVKSCDVVWSEWCNELAFGVAESGLAKKFLIRMRGYDVWMPLARMAWKNVRTLVYESSFMQTLAEEQLPALIGGVTVSTAIIPSGIDLGEFQYARRRPFSQPVLALIARTTADKGYQLAFEYARQRPNIEMHVTTALSEANPRLLRYLQHTKPKNVVIHDTVDTATWLNNIHATHLLSCSIWETLGYTIAEGMAVGCKPLIHAAPGVDLNWPSNFLWRSFEDLDRLLAEPIVSEDYRSYVEKHLNAEHGTELFTNLVLG